MVSVIASITLITTLILSGELVGIVLGCVTVGKNPNKRGLHNYKEFGIYNIQDLLDFRESTPWSRVDL